MADSATKKEDTQTQPRKRTGLGDQLFQELERNHQRQPGGNQAGNNSGRGYKLGKLHLSTTKSDTGVSVEEMLAREAAAEAAAAAAAKEVISQSADSKILPSQPIRLDLIDLSPYQPRTLFDEERITALADTMQAAGQTTPIMVREKGDRYELVSGERRLRAALLLNWEYVRAEIYTCTDNQAKIAALIENDTRENLCDFERGVAYGRLIEEKVAANQADLGRQIGQTKQYINKCMGFLQLPKEAIEIIKEQPDAINHGTAASLLAIYRAHPEDADLIVDAVSQMIRDGVTQTNATNKLKAEVRKRHSPAAAQPQARVLKIHNRHVGEVRLVDKRKIVITCAPGLDRDEVLRMITEKMEQSS